MLKDKSKAINLTEDEYKIILSFLHDIQTPGKQYINILNCLVQYFGYSCSTLWIVHDDFSMDNPIGVNINRQLMDEYIKHLHIYDDFHLKKMDPKMLASASVLDNDDFVQHISPNPYIDWLKKEKVHHKHTIILRTNGKIRGGIALFKPLKESKASVKLSPHCLEVVAPFIAQEFVNRQLYTAADQTASILKTVLNTGDTGIILFNRYEPSHIVYYNPICTRYCFDFIGSDHPSTIVSHFIEAMIVPLGSSFLNTSDITMKLTSLSGNQYRFRLVDNGPEYGNICTLFITPLSSTSTPAPAFKSLFSQLTPKEREITLLISQGLTNGQIADHLYISISTVKSHIQHIFDKAKVANRASLIALLYESDK